MVVGGRIPAEDVRVAPQQLLVAQTRDILEREGMRLAHDLPAETDHVEQVGQLLGGVVVVVGEGGVEQLARLVHQEAGGVGQRLAAVPGTAAGGAQDADGLEELCGAGQRHGRSVR